MDVIELSSIILVLWVFPTPEAMCPLEWFFHRLHVLLVGDLAGTSLVKWMVGSRGRGKEGRKEEREKCPQRIKCQLDFVSHPKI